jgi:hypothetical protein
MLLQQHGRLRLTNESGAANSNIPVVLEHHALPDPDFYEESANLLVQYQELLE